MNDSQTIPYGTCHCGCGEKTSIATSDSDKYGWVKGKPRRYRVGHVGSKTIGEKLDLRTDPPNENGCVLWNQSTGNSSYGSLSHRGRRMTAHRWAWVEAHGEIPEGFQVHHKCHEPLCCNPDHLEAVDPKKHVKLHLSNECANGHPWTEASTYFPPSGARICRICQNNFQKAHYRNPPPPKDCEICGTNFQPQNRIGRYCSPPCSKKGYARSARERAAAARG